MASESLISIITPVLNGRAYIEETFQSVLHQEHEHWEWLVVDNGSTDGTLEYLRSIEDPRVKVFEEPIAGVSRARNKALDQYQGEYCCFLDADDRLTPQSLSSRLTLFERDENVSIVDGAVQVFDHKSGSTIWTWTPECRGDITSALLRMDERCFFGCTWMVRRLVIGEKRFSEALTLAEDLEFFLQLSPGRHLEFTDETILEVRRGHASTMSNLNQLQDRYKALIEKLRLSFDDSDLDIMKQKCNRIVFRSLIKQGRLFAAIQSSINRLR